jgi:aspartyl-tRNA(Asn)/glutamyl-tRNA(Gln) amidotransferase subunit A
MDDERIWQSDACELAAAIKAQELKATKVAEVHLRRIEKYNEVLNAVVYLDPDSALQTASRIDEAIAAGEDPGSLAGIPILVKDLEDVAGMPTTRGSLLFAANVATCDSTHVARLKKAGVVVLGKSAAPEFGSIPFTRSKLFGITRNPWDTAKTPGGSSGGSAAAVAAALVPLATASDGGGSTRIPASYTGLVGHKPTRGLVPHGPGYAGLARFSVLGCLSRSVRDTARYLDCVSGPSPYDTDTYPVTPHFESLLEQDLPRPLKAGWSATLGFGTCDPEVERIARAAAEAVCKVCDISLEDVEIAFKDPAKAWSVLGSVDLLYELRDYLPDRYDDLTPVVQASVQMARHLTIEDIGRAGDRVHGLVEVQAELFERIDLLFTPTTSTTAFDAGGPMPLEIAGRRVGPMGALPFTYPFNLTGNPAISVPAGTDSSGMPVGLQIVGPRFSDGLLLQVAHRYEKAVGWQKFAPLALD